MTATLDTAAATTATTTTAPAAESGPGVRRAVQLALPAVAGVLLAAATLTDPGAANEGREMIKVYAAEVDQLQWHATLLHLAYGVWGVVPLALVPLVRGRGRGLMNLAAVLGFLVMVSMPALMMSDLFFAAITNESGLDAASRIYDGMGGEQWAVKAYLLPGLVSMLLVLPVTFAALARARRTPWWAVVPALLVLPTFAVFGAAGVGVVVPAGLLAGLSVVLARAPR
ncbi:hypothetical protein [Nocardioides marmoribigeumensis]|uniref:DUF4386 family protein n=1 Tax=Nocardioides marmoribigeumensis TaxID=433649 RepID=A0ABU2BRJ8_9ACTN|nr:hypothetical protein [Nocardioides marmoribigeumensis]MDR7361267.1 hypothetical protein [Nocardioides marmoribigeumensis]